MAVGDSLYITTPIFYVNDAPHIGHAYTEVAVDVIARWHRQAGVPTWMLTGTDEHGQKILRTASAHHTLPKAWADRLVQDAWLPLLRTVDIRNDDFIRTTEPRHEENVKKFLQLLRDRGFIYTGEFEGFYCVGCEEYKTPGELVPGKGEYEGRSVCAIHSKPVESLRETNYFFKMSAFADQLLKLYADRPDFVRPESALNEVASFVRGGLSDLSISRTSFDWGVKIPWDESHVVYVWFDALLNYATAVGYGSDEKRFNEWWPAVHVVGKDILRFHAVIWPAMLMAAGLEVPHQVFGHGWLLVGGEKMSKSKLTGIAPTEITDTFGSDAFRHYFLSAFVFGQDGSFSWEDFSARYHAELANGLGNLASRVVAMIERYFGGAVPAVGEQSMADAKIRVLERTVTNDSWDAIRRIAPHDAIASVWRLVDALNAYLTDEQPWQLAKDSARRDRLETVLAVAYRGLGTLAVLLSAVLPKTTTVLWRSLGCEGTPDAQRIDRAFEAHLGTQVAALPILFPRIEESDAESGAAGNGSATAPDPNAG